MRLPQRYRQLEPRARSAAQFFGPRAPALCNEISQVGTPGPPVLRKFVPIGLKLTVPAFLRLPRSQWRSARTTNAVERLHEGFKRRIKTQAVLPSAETAAMLSWALLASGQITMRKVDGWRTLSEQPAAAVPLDLAA